LSYFTVVIFFNELNIALLRYYLYLTLCTRHIGNIQSPRKACNQASVYM